jgi:hypothetical protein
MASTYVWTPTKSVQQWDWTRTIGTFELLSRNFLEYFFLGKSLKRIYNRRLNSDCQRMKMTVLTALFLALALLLFPSTSSFALHISFSCLHYPPGCPIVCSWVPSSSHLHHHWPHVFLVWLFGLVRIDPRPLLPESSTELSVLSCCPIPRGMSDYSDLNSCI